MPLPSWLRWMLGLGLASFLVIAPTIYFRCIYTRDKRFREVDPGRFYRCGQLTVAGFTDNVQRYGIRTIVNLQDEYPDPDVRQSYWNGHTVKESELCRQLGVRYVYLPPELIDRRLVPEQHPPAIDRFLSLLDGPGCFPVLIHCKAGLHRTGVMTAVYRMEYQRWSPRAAIDDMRANGFGPFVSCSDNDYITQFVLTYQPRQDSSIGERGTKVPRDTCERSISTPWPTSHEAHIRNQYESD